MAALGGAGRRRQLGDERVDELCAHVSLDLLDGPWIRVRVGLSSLGEVGGRGRRPALAVLEGVQQSNVGLEPLRDDQVYALPVGHRIHDPPRVIAGGRRTKTLERHTAHLLMLSASP